MSEKGESESKTSSITETNTSNSADAPTMLLQRPQTARLSNVECPCCRRFYTEHSIEFHMKVCSPRKAEEERRRRLQELHLERLNRRPRRPPGHPCYICGGRFTDHTWSQHEAKCTRQWNIWNDLLPKGLKHEGIVKPDTSEEAITEMMEKEKASGSADFTKLDALDKIMIEASRLNALPQ